MTPTTVTRAAAPGLLCLLLGLPSAALAVDRVSYPYRGVVHVHRVQPGLDAHVLTVDLNSAEIDVVATRPRERWATVSLFAREQDVQIAINANFYAGSTCGLAM